MTVILLLFVILGFCLAITRYWKWPVETTPFFVTSAMMASLYVAASMHVLASVSLVILFLGILLFVWQLYVKYKEYGQKNKPFIGYSLLLFAALCGLLWLKVRHGVLVNNDDFSHWALVAKDMYLSHSWASAGGYIAFTDYPPGTALFQYFLFRINDLYLPNGYSEDTAMLAQGILLIAALLPLLVTASRHHKVLVFLVGGAIYFALFAFGPGLRSLNVDHVLGVYFGMALATWWLTGRDRDASLRIVPIIICLPIIKSSGVFFAGLLILFILVQQLYLYFVIHGDGRNRFRGMIWLPLLIMPLLLFAAQSSWKGHVDDINAGATFSTNISLAEINRSLFGISTEKEKIIIENFVDRLKPLRFADSSAGISRTKLQRTGFFILVLLCFSLIIVRWAFKQDKVGIALLMLCLVLGLAGYMLGLLVLYLFSFGAYEAVILASFDRYIAIYLLAWVLIVMALLLYGLGDSTNHKRVYIALLAMFALCAGFGFGGGGGVRFIVQDSSKPGIEGGVIKPLVQKFRSFLTADTKVYFIWQNGAGFPCFLAKYEAIPARVNPTSSQVCSLGSPYGKDDMWTRNISPQQWSLELESYNYVMLGYVDQSFWHRFGILFDDVRIAKVNHMFRVDKSLGEMVKLIPVIAQ